jgi:hypothetical protein
MSCHPAVRAIEQSVDEGESRKRSERRTPPNLLGEEDDSIRAAENVSVGGKDAHFLQGFVGGEPEPLEDPGLLERFEMESTFRKDGGETPGKIGAKAAIPVEEDPAAERNCFRRFSYFCQLRNHK